MLKTSHVATAAAAVFVAFVGWIVAGASHGSSLKSADDIVFVGMAIPSIILATMAARATTGRARAAWIAMLIGLVGWAVGDILWAYYELSLDKVPFPSPADAAYLVMPVGFCIGLLLFPADRSHQFRGRMLLDGVIVAGSLFLASWVTILRPLYEVGADSTLALVLSLAYPVSDVVILTIAAVAAVRAAPEQRLVLALLTLAIACIALSDSAFAYLSLQSKYSSGNAIDIGWMAGLLLIMVAAAASREGAHSSHRQVSLPGWASIWFPYAPLLLAGIVAAVEPPNMFQTPLVELVGALLVCTVLARQFLAVSENRRLLKVVAEQALRDPLTGLGNRAMFAERLDEAMEQRARDNTPVSLIALDLNDFKLVNDTLGHAAGDDLLNRAGERILGCVRNGDTVARLGGDEFVVLVEGDAESAELVAQRVVTSFDKPFLIEGHDLFIRPSVGLAVADVDEGVLSAEDLLKQADTAMYSAKKSSKHGVQRFSPEIYRLATADDGSLNRLGERPTEPHRAADNQLAELRQAIDQYELTVLYQPKVEIRTRRIVGVEALVRWRHPKRGLLSPDEFLPLVRRYGLMGSITDLVINLALDDVRRFRKTAPDLSVAVNISAPLFADTHLPTRVARALADRRLSASALTLEITEDLLLGNLAKTREVLDTLRSNGIAIAIDDFGSGYSSLAYLCDLAVDEVKLDRELVAAVVDDARVATVVRYSVDLAHELGLTTVAEGVESAELAARVAELGCDVVQGFYYSPPVPATELMELLSSTAAFSAPTASEPAAHLT
ncbi:putative bifunctional diguanylate cyclase/phosphodiesterase [Mycolicibacterium anyangense]|uniref:putative bifunctional diguanylate cyclase/phosphodiesterase n=1 Tax=Mycolicibacterium anyangense TaxID=1431246 RepID=UPI0013D08216|nr:bifunctional diguanylate cyclase/phosphodiesterase [Mycolicibacterium anyangense]